MLKWLIQIRQNDRIIGWFVLDLEAHVIHFHFSGSSLKDIPTFQSFKNFSLRQGFLEPFLYYKNSLQMKPSSVLNSKSGNKSLLLNVDTPSCSRISFLMFWIPWRISTPLHPIIAKGWEQLVGAQESKTSRQVGLDFSAVAEVKRGHVAVIMSLAENKSTFPCTVSFPACSRSIETFFEISWTKVNVIFFHSLSAFNTQGIWGYLKTTSFDFHAHHSVMQALLGVSHGESSHPVLEPIVLIHFQPSQP